MTTAEAIRNIEKLEITLDRRPHLLKTLEEVDLMEKGILPKKSAKTFLSELRSK